MVTNLTHTKIATFFYPRQPKFYTSLHFLFEQMAALCYTNDNYKNLQHRRSVSPPATARQDSLFCYFYWEFMGKEQVL